MAVRTTKSAARTKGGRDVHGRTTRTNRATRRADRQAAGPESTPDTRGVCGHPHGLERSRAAKSLDDVPVSAAGAALPTRSTRDAERIALIRHACDVLSNAAKRVADCEPCRSVVPLCESVHMDLDQRIGCADRLVVHDVLIEARHQLDAVLEQLGQVLVDDADALLRLRELEALKPLYGIEPVIHGGREAGDVVTQETAATDRSGTERQRNAACQGRCPRATAGQRAGRKSC